MTLFWIMEYIITFSVKVCLMTVFLISILRFPQVLSYFPGKFYVY